MSGVDPVTYTYDGQGRVASVQQGARTTAYAYGGDGFLASIQDPLGRTVSDGTPVAFAYDADGDLTSLTPP